MTIQYQVDVGSDGVLQIDAEPELPILALTEAQKSRLDMLGFPHRVELTRALPRRELNLAEAVNLMEGNEAQLPTAGEAAALQLAFGDVDYASQPQLTRTVALVYEQEGKSYFAIVDNSSLLLEQIRDATGRLAVKRQHISYLLQHAAKTERRVEISSHDVDGNRIVNPSLLEAILWDEVIREGCPPNGSDSRIVKLGGAYTSIVGSVRNTPLVLVGSVRLGEKEERSPLSVEIMVDIPQVQGYARGVYYPNQ